MATRSGSRERRWLMGLVLCALVCGGCSQIRLPAIDPTGERIFLPSPYATNLENPCSFAVSTPRCLQPAWETPPAPPPCPEPPPGAPLIGVPAPPVVATPAPPRTKHPHLDKLKQGHEQLGHITLNPTKVIAPVGGEVVLLAGLCDQNGLYVKREPVRWILTNDSVGHFVEVGDDERSKMQFASSNDSKLLSGDFAEGRTSSKRNTITRGTPSQLDDVQLLAGQAWVSLTSPVEGISYVTVIAPDAAIWSDRRQTATIHWIDAQWQFPQPSVVQAGSTASLVTTVTRTSGESPPPNWLVRYELVGDSPARFPGGQTAIDVPLDGNGRAGATLVSPPGQPGVSQVKVQVIRVDGTGSRLVVVEGWTSITWSAPALAVDIAGPSVGGVGSTLVYRLQVSNPGDIAVSEVAATVDLPNGLRFVSASPTSQVFGNRVEWRLGELPARGRTELQLNVRADFAQNFRLIARAAGANGLQAESFIDTQINEAALDVQMEGPESAVVGDRVQYRVLVRNTGSYPLTNVVLRDRFDEGLQHSEGKSSPLERPLGTIQPGEERPVAITFIVRRPGRWCHVLEVFADGQSKSAQACLVATDPKPVVPQLEVRKTGPRQARVGDQVRFVIDVINIGETTVGNVQIVDVLDPAFNPTDATNGFDVNQLPQGRLVWNVRQLAPGQKTVIEVQCQCVQASNGAVNRVTVTADPGVSEGTETVTQILAAAATVPAPTPAPIPRPAEGASPAPAAPAPRAGEGLVISIADETDPALVGDRIVYNITVKNSRGVEDRNVRLRITLPDGLKFQRVNRAALGPADAIPLQPQFSPDGQTVELPEVLTIRAGETLPKYVLEVIAQRAGRYTLRAEASSLRSATPAEDAEETTVFAR